MPSNHAPLPVTRRGTYFAFQGLLFAVLLLIFLYQYRGFEGWVGRLALLLGTLGFSMVLLRLVPERTLGRWWFQAALFLGDALVASAILHWTEPLSDLYIIYFLIIFGTALTRSLAQSFVVAVICSALYLGSAWRPSQGLPQDTGFWLRVHFLWVTSALLAILSRDAQNAQKDQEHRFQERLIRVESLAALGQVAGEVAHRIKGPLTTIMVNAEVLAARSGGSRVFQRELKQIRTEASRCKEILKDLLDLGRIEEILFERMDLREPLRTALKSMQPQFRRYSVKVETAGLESPLKVRGDPSLLHEAFVAILQNAVDAMGAGGGLVRLKAWPRRRGVWRFLPGGRPDAYAVSISDDGAGIEPRHLESVFQPFFTTKGKEGSGLGLSAALRILQKHGGTIEAYSEGRHRGTCFTVTVPIAAPRVTSRTL